MDRLEIKGNPNYAAMVVPYDPANEVELPNRDRVIGYKVLGYQSIVGKGEYEAGEQIVVFGAETQLSDQFTSLSNLYRHEHLNVDPTRKGYLGDNRRVRAIKLGGNRSDALVMPLSSLDYALGGLPELEIPDYTAFDTIGDVEICRKYVVPVKGNGASMATKQGQKRVRVQTRHFPEHYNTPNGFRNLSLLEEDDHVVVTQKLHGTSVRIAKVPVARDLTWFERMLVRLRLADVKEAEYGVVVGSRHVTKSINGKVEAGKRHWYESGDIWTQATAGMGELIPEDFVVFAEIVGWTPDGAPIQPGYTYNVPRGRQEVYVYRVATVNGQGDLVDLPWRAVERFCEARGWKTAPVLGYGPYREFSPEGWMDLRIADQFNPVLDAVPLSDPNTVDEGVVVRSDTGFQPTALKFKSPIFLGHETALLDQGAEDIEEAA